MRSLLMAIMIAALLGACSSDDTVSGPAPSASPEVVLPDGWRWESYRGVEVAVPGNWGWASSRQRLGQWCVEPRPDQSPAIGRPGASTLVACGIEQRPPAETLIANTGPIVAFEDATMSDGTPMQVARGGDREIISVGDVHVIVQVPQPLRDQVAATVRSADVDANDCPATDPVSRDVDRRPDAGAGVAGLRGVRSVSACKYQLLQEPSGAPAASGAATLLSSVRLTGPDASRLVRQIAHAPAGGGPNSPQNCLAAYSRGDEIVVLRITSSERVSSVHVRYSGCDHHGFDDGVVLRRLVRDPLMAVLPGASQVGGWDGDLYRQLVE
jgi:hypothetical protein